jgi:hypothetical protein
METKLQEIINQQRQKEVAVVDEQREEVSESWYYGLWKGSVRESNERYLDLKFRDGQRTSFDYPDRKFVNYNPEMPCIDMDFAGNMVTIIGRNLEPLYELFLKRKTEWVREANTPGQDDGVEGIFVEEILITPAERAEEQVKTEENESA